jgi:hypothetical protein
MSAATVARLKITLDSVKPAVLRRVEVPFDIRLDRLHLTIQAAMGWTNSHLYELRARDVGWSTPLPGIHGGGDFLDARKARLDDVLEDIGTKTLRYVYDFGDGWEHTITIERLADPEPGVLYPRLIEVSGRCPPTLHEREYPSYALFSGHFEPRNGEQNSLFRALLSQTSRIDEVAK